MSDFDKEAEREKLREQLEEDEESRQHTRRMSELLLKGATMTNGHCDNCGDPIFRHDGQEFCPTCNTGQQGAAGGQGETAAEETTTEQSAAEGSTPNGPAGRSTGADGPSGAADPQSGGEPSPPARTATPAASQPTPDNAAAASFDASTGGGDVAAAADALRATLTKFAAKAAETDDPGRAREYLAAAREAAEALDALPY